MQRNHSQALEASSPSSMRNSANKQELINLRCSSSGGAAGGEEHGVPAALVWGPSQARAWPSAFHRPSGLGGACAEAGELGPGKSAVSQDAYSLPIALLAPLA